MGALDHKTRRHRRNRLAAELAVTYHPRRHFRLGQDIGWHWQIDDPNTLYRRRNRLTYSRDFSNAAWTKVNATVTVDADGVGDLLVPTTANSTHAIVQSPVVPGVPAAMTVRAKAGGYNWIAIQLGSTGAAYINISTGTAGSASAGYSISTPVSAGSGYYDFTVTRTDPNITSAYIFVANADGGASFAGDGTSGVYIARAQLETYTTTPTEYQDVPTTWAQAYLDAVGAERIYAWTDTAGTIPNTAIGEGIGLLLGREYGGARGVERVTNGGFDSDLTGWTNGLGSIAWVSGAMEVTRPSAGVTTSGYQAITTVVGKTYEVTGMQRIVSVGAAPNIVARTGTDPNSSPSVGFGSAGVSTSMTPNRFVFTATGTTTYLHCTAGTGAGVVAFDSISVREIPGTHLTQATGTAKPTLSARVNLLLASNDFTSASWVKTNILSTTADADGIGDLVIPSTANATHAVTQSPVTAGVPTVMHVRAKANGYNWLAIQLGSTGAAYVNISSGAAGSASSGYSISTPVAAGSGYFDFTVTRTDPNSTAASIFVANADGGASFAGNGTSGVYLARADCRTADDAAKNIPAYQWVGATATDHDTDGFPHAQTADGTDDSGTTATGGGNTTGFFYCGALTVSGGAGTARTIWSDTGTNTGYRVRINSSNKLELAAGNGTAYTTVASNETITAPGTYLLSAWDDGGVLAVQVNNLAPATTTRPAVSAGTAVITAYKDNGAASSYFNGRDYGSVYRQQYPGETAHNRIKRYLANVARITV